MRVECPQCKTLSPLRTFEAQGGLLVFVCGACGGEQRLVSRPPMTATAQPPQPTRPVATAQVTSPQAAWEKVLSQWEQPKAHEQFTAYCAGVGALPFAGACYRERLEREPQNPQALKGRERVMAAAMTVAHERKELAAVARPKRNYKPYLAVGMVVFFLGVTMMISRTLRAIAHVAETDNYTE